MAHHDLPLTLNSLNRKRLLQDLGVADSADTDALAGRVHAVLARYHGLKAISPSRDSKRLASILELANALDEYFEWERLVPDGEPPDELVREALQCFWEANDVNIRSLLANIPPLPLSAERSVNLISSDKTDIDELETLVHADQALDRQIRRIAGIRRTNLRQVTRQLGHATTHQLICAASIKRLFTAAPMRLVWNHSVDVALTAERLASKSSQLDPTTAFIGGLLHDIGRLLMNFSPRRIKNRYQRMRKYGCCEDVIIETALGRLGHGAGGAIILEFWKLSPPLAEGVEFHHQPERAATTLASLLYLADEACGSMENVKSCVRFNEALGTVRLRHEDVAGAAVAPDNPLELLKYAA